MSGQEGACPFDVVFCDSCVGGSTVAAGLARHATGLRALYLADYAVNPLGTKRDAEIRDALDRWIDASARQAPVVVIACNTASVRLEASGEIRRRAKRLGLDVYSMIDLLDILLAREGVGGERVCVMGTRYTVGRPTYAERLERAGAGEVAGLTATRTERTVARLEHASAAGRDVVRAEISDGIRNADAVVLACTCFPLVGDVIAEINPRIRQLDPGSEIGALIDWPDRGGPNRMTLAYTGDAPGREALRARMPELFPGWDRVDVVSLND